MDATDSNITGNLSVSGASSFNHVTVSGILDADRIELDSPYGSKSLGGSHNHIGGESLTIGAMDTNVDGRLKVNGDLKMNGLRANFENAEEVRVPTPDQDNEAANKAYVDSVVVPSGGLIAWPAANPIPTGWSNPGLTAPMTDYIWIQKY